MIVSRVKKNKVNALRGRIRKQLTIWARQYRRIRNGSKTSAASILQCDEIVSLAPKKRKTVRKNVPAFIKKPQETFKMDDRYGLTRIPKRRQFSHFFEFLMANKEMSIESAQGIYFEYPKATNRLVNQASISDIVSYFMTQYPKYKRRYNMNKGENVCVLTQSADAATQIKTLIQLDAEFDEKEYPILFSKGYPIAEDENEEIEKERRQNEWDAWLRVKYRSHRYYKKMWLKFLVYRDQNDLDEILSAEYLKAGEIGLSRMDDYNIIMLEMPPMISHILGAVYNAKSHVEFYCDRPVAYFNPLKLYLDCIGCHKALPDDCEKRLNRKTMATLCIESNQREFLTPSPSSSIELQRRWRDNWATSDDSNDSLNQESSSSTPSYASTNNAPSSDGENLDDTVFSSRVIWPNPFLTLQQRYDLFINSRSNISQSMIRNPPTAIAIEMSTVEDENDRAATPAVHNF
jgi:hypothetical protein